MTAVPLAAQAQRKSPLADAPAIRKRYELRATRLEVGAGFGSTINQDFYHSMFFNLKLGFHITDWLAISRLRQLRGGEHRDHLPEQHRRITLTPTAVAVISEPTKNAAVNSMQKINDMFGAQLELAPFAGKYSLFGKLFAHYDFYGFGGVGLISVAPTDAGIAPCAGTNPEQPTRQRRGRITAA